MKTFNEFHDGYLDGLLIHGSGLSVFLSTADKQRFLLKAGGVLSLRMDGFRQGNIVYEVLVRDGDEVTLDDINSLYEFTDETKAISKLEETRRSGRVVLEINPSYGATFIALAESVEILNHRESVDRDFTSSAVQSYFS